MTMTFKELFELEFRERRDRALREGRAEGIEKGRREQIDNAVLSLRKVLRRRKIDPSRYEKHFAKLLCAGQVADMTVAVATAKDPEAYLRSRFKTRGTYRRRSRRTPASSAR